MALETVANAALSAAVGAPFGVIFGELVKVVKHAVIHVLEFNPQFTSLETTLKKFEAACKDTTELSKMLDRPVEETKRFTRILEQGKELVIKCSRIKVWNVIDKQKYAKKLIKLDEEILRFFHMDAQAMLLSTSKKILTEVTTANSRAGRISGLCNVPGPPEFVTRGMDRHLAELKKMLLHDETRLLVIAAPGGFGKTTLAKVLCHDPEIKGEFGDNIFYFTVSQKASILNIATKLFKCNDINYFSSEEDAKNQIENLIKQTGSGKKLLVLDDVWPKSASIIRDLKFNIPGFKILVTSRSEIPNSTRYDLSLLNDEDAKSLLCHFAFPHDGNKGNNVSDDLVNKIVKFCGGIPLALEVVGGSLCDQSEVEWVTTLTNWSEGQSILESHEGLQLRLQTSIDALDELPKNCFLDLGLFPEDDKIPGTLLMDMWVEFHKLDDEGLNASKNLRILKSRNLINLVPTRKSCGEREGHCSQYRVMQHDVLRDLAIHMSRQKPETKRERLFMEINSNNFPEWSIQVPQQPIDAHILSISTDEEFNSTWYDLNAPNVKVLILNIRSENYSLPSFIKTMTQLKVLIITGYGVYPTLLNDLDVLTTLSNLNRIRFGHVSFSTSIQVFTLKTLEKLTFVMCKIGDAFNSGPNGSPYMLENLKELEIDFCSDLKELTAQICSSVQLKKLIITNCQELDLLPEDLGNLSDLEIMRLHCCTKLREFPESIERMRKLRLIDISDCLSITALPEQIGELVSLKGICVNGCEGLAELPVSFTKLKQLEDVWCNEEKSHLFKNIETHLCKMKINIVEEDRTLTFKKICGDLS